MRATIIKQRPWLCRLFGHQWEPQRSVTGRRGRICWRCMSEEWD